MLSRLEPYAYALFRIVTGLLFIFHGLQKFGIYGGQSVNLATRLGVAALIEAVGGGLVMIGLFTGPVAFICSGEMAAAYFLSHAPQAFWPIQNRGELAVLYCFAFLYMATRGSGIWSIDWLRGRRGRR
ncbi:MAG TPA: DoxX family protein [Vicinamibacterales bacterium]|jgi:putative oxidoreductase|nr:DoxX family protein [Vicinamibacterales bacterium]